MTPIEFDTLIEYLERIRSCAEECTARGTEIKNNENATEADLLQAIIYLKQSEAYLNCHELVASFLTKYQIKSREEVIYEA